MKRALILGSLAALLTTGLAAVGPAQAATVRVDTKCAKVNERVQVRGTTYRCTQSGTRAVWKVQANTVRVGRGCTREGELATVGAAKVLHSCTYNMKSRTLVWKKAIKACRDSVADTAKIVTEYRNVLAGLAEAKASYDAGDAVLKETLKADIERLEKLVKDFNTILGLSRTLTTEACSF